MLTLLKKIKNYYLTAVQNLTTFIQDKDEYFRVDGRTGVFSAWHQLLGIKYHWPVHEKINTDYISGYSLHSICKWSVCPRYRQYMNSNQILENDYVFLNLDFFEDFLSYLQKNLPIHRFELVTQNSDRDFTLSMLQSIRPFVHKIYAINCTVNDSIITKLPIGFNDQSILVLDKMDRVVCIKTNLVYLNFKIKTHLDRIDCYNHFKDLDWVCIEPNTLPVNEFYHKLKTFKYCVCPRGTGIDTHRIWECLLFGVLPIVKRSALDDLYEKFPILLVDDWCEVSPEFLTQQYEERMQGYSYWVSNNQNWFRTSSWLRPHLKKIIAFSLWGNSNRYLGGAIQNVELARYFYPGWICRFYIGETTNKTFIDSLLKYGNVELVMMKETGDWRGMCWRFLPASENDVEIMLSRDADSRITPREKAAVQEWINSAKSFHIMRDNIQHNTLILGGMWGAKKGCIPNVNNLIRKYNPGNFWQSDQNFLKKIIYPIVVEKSMIHDEFFNYEKTHQAFPTISGARNPLHFVGQAYDGDGKILDSDEYFQDFIRNYYVIQ